MKTFRLSFALLFLYTGALSAADEPTIDAARGRQLMERFKAGEPLSADDQAYLERVKQAIRERSMNKQNGGTPKAAVAKTTTLLLNFFKTNAAASRWFVKAGEKVEPLTLPKDPP